MSRIIVLILIFFLISSCGSGQIKNKEDLKEVTNEILHLVKENSIVKDSINFPEFEAEIANEIDNMQNISEANFIILRIFKTLNKYGDHHSFYMDKNVSDQYLSEKEMILMPSSKLIDNSIGLLVVPTHLSMNNKDNSSYANTLRTQIQNIDENHKTKGWIIDLRSNGGGNMWPMISGLNPIISDGIVGYFVSNKERTAWYSNSKSPQAIPKIKNQYKVKNFKNKIAILVGERTASSGEMTAISMIGKKNTKSFGSKTSGYTTANGYYKLTNGASISLANSYCEDINKKKYIGSIKPDIEVDNDKIIDEAVKWILK